MTNSHKFRMGDLITRRKDVILVLPDQTYSRVTIRTNHGGVSVRDTVAGSEINTERQFVVSGGQFIVSKIDARNGAFGIVPDVCNGAIITGNFWVFDVNPDLLVSDYLRYFVQTKLFSGLCVSASDGTTNRRYLDETKFLNSDIVLPELTDQHRIVSYLDAASAAIQARKQIADAVEGELISTLNAAFRHVVSDAPRVRMGVVAPLVRRPVEIEPDGIYHELGVRSFGRGLFDKPLLTGADLTWQKLFQIRKGDLVFSNIKAWEGAFAVAKPQDDGKVGSHRYLTCVAAPDRTTPSFLWYYLQTKEGLEEIQAASPGSADRNRTLSQKGLEEIEIPVPAIDAQLWFDELQIKASVARAQSAEAAAELRHLIPAMLNQVF
jgi:type I restriction enzyme, S subunit